jgi:hypothetical protein
MKKITLLLVVLILLPFLISCGNSPKDQKLSESRRAEITQLELEIKNIDTEISLLIEQNEKLSDSSNLSDPGDSDVSRNYIEINTLKSEREVLVNKLNALNKSEQEDQSKK